MRLQTENFFFTLQVFHRLAIRLNDIDIAIDKKAGRASKVGRLAHPVAAPSNLSAKRLIEDLIRGRSKQI